MPEPELTDWPREQRLMLIADLYTLFYAHTESFELRYGAGTTPVGADIAYLFAAIARNTYPIALQTRNSLRHLLAVIATTGRTAQTYVDRARRFYTLSDD